jgi:hypothetical protein
MRQLIRLGADPHGADVADRAVRFYGKIGRGQSKPLYTGLISVARLQLKKPDAALTDKEIVDALTKAKAKVSGLQAIANQVSELVTVKDDAAIANALTIIGQLNSFIDERWAEISAVEAAIGEAVGIRDQLSSYIAECGDEIKAAEAA